MFREEKRLVSMLLCIALLLTMLPVSVFASAEPLSVYCQAPDNWINCKVYWWGSSSGNPSWSGYDMYQDTNGIWCYDGLPSDSVGVIFTDGLGHQSADLSVPSENGWMYVYEDDYWTYYESGSATPDRPVISSLGLSISANDTQVVVGDTVTFHVYGTGIDVIALEFGLTIPEGMTYVPGSAVVPEGLRTSLGWAAVDWTEATMKWTGYGDLGAEFKNTRLLSFQCTLDAGGSYAPVLVDPLSFDSRFSEQPLDWTCNTVTCLDGSYFVAGSMNDWITPDAVYKMVKQSDGTWALTLYLEAGEYELKVTDGTWYNSWGGDGPYGNYAFTAAESGEYTVTFDGTTVNVTGNVAEPVPEPLPAIEYVVVAGSAGLVGAEWDPAWQNAVMAANGSVYTITFTDIAAGEYIYKFVANGNWELQWASGVEAENGVWQNAWFSPLDNTTLTVTEDNSTVTLTLDLTNMDPVTGDGALCSALIETQICDHSWSEATCTDPATCIHCGAVSGEALGHDYDDGFVTKQPTCTTQGVVVYACDRCLEVKSQQLPTTDHSYETVVTAPTCTEGGYSTHTCIGCQDTYTDSITPATGHSYSVTVVAPTCTGGGYTQHTCTVCGYAFFDTITPAAGHRYDKGICTGCGAVDPNYVAPSVTAPTLTLKYPALTFEDVITMNVFFSAENLQDVVEMGLITYKSAVTEWNVENAEAVVPGYELNPNGFYTASTEGIAAKDMGDTYWFAVYAKLSDGSYTYTKLVSYSPTTYAANQLSDPAMSKLVVAMLNYGAAAQTYFGYNTDNLMNKDLTTDQLASIETYRADMLDSISTVTAEKSANFTRTATGFATRYPTISFEGAFSIDYFCQPNATVQGDITLYYWNQADFDACDVLSIDNVTGALALVNNNGTYATAVEGIAAKDLDKGVYVTFVYSDGTNTYCSGILGYSIGMYCQGLAGGSDAMAPFAAATAVYGYYAKQMFN